MICIGCREEKAYQHEGRQWYQCLDCLRKSYQPERFVPSFWKGRSERFQESHLALLEHYDKIMRRYSMRMQRIKGKNRVYVKTNQRAVCLQENDD